MPQTARSQDPNGFLLIKQCPISSFGIFDYSAAQVGLGGDPNRIVKVFRPESAVNDPEFLASFDVVPFINDHEMLSGFEGDSSATAPEDYGIDGVLFNVGYAKPWTRGDLKIFTRGMQADLNSGKKDVSLGYTCDFIEQSGMFDGQEYEVVQTNMRGNHIALVDAGRVPGARVLDSRTGKRLCFDHLDISRVQIGVHNQGVIQMPKQRKALDANVVAQLQAQLKQLLPTFEAFLSQEAAEPEHQGAAGAAGAAEGAAEPAGDPNAAGATAPATEPNAAPAADPNAAEPVEGEQDGGEGGASLQEVVSQLEALLGQLKSAMGGEAAPAAPAAEGAEAGGEAGAEGEGSEDNGGAENGEGEDGEGAEEGEDGVDPLNGTAQDPTGSNAPGADGEGEHEGEDGEGAEGRELGEGGQGRASEGPAAGVHHGADAALRGFYADAAVKNRLINRLSKVVGTFDGRLDIARSTASDIAVYGVKRLKLKAEKGCEIAVLDGYLAAYEAGTKRAKTTTQQNAADAAAAQTVPAIDAYFAQEKK